MEDQGHSPLKSGSDIFKAERHLPICKGTPRTNKCSFMLVLGFDLDLIVSGKAVHKGKYLASLTLIQNDPNLCVNEMKEQIKIHNTRHFAKITEIQ